MNINLETQAQLNFVQRITGTFLSPRAVFEDAASRTSWLPLLVLMCIITLGFSLLTIGKVQEFFQITMEAQMQTVPGSPDLTAMMLKTVTITAVVGGALSPIIFCLLAALLLKLCNAFVGEKIPYRQFFAISVYAYLPMLIASMLTSIIISLTPAANFGEVSTGLYLFFPPGSTGFAASLARQIDPFYLWSIFLVSLGGAVLSQAKVKSYAIFMFGVWALFSVGSALLAA
jgi:hypothetical protein